MQKRKIYLAGSCSAEQRTNMMRLARLLRDNPIESFEVYCPFELKIPDAWSYSQEEWADMVFNADIEEINNCDIFLMVSPGRIGTAGTNWEQGYAYANWKLIIVAQFGFADTSLMTYCGCDSFRAYADFDALIEGILSQIQYAHTTAKREPCKTVLT